jgi:hypothetical protein
MFWNILGVGRMVIFWFLKKQAMALWTGFILLRIGFRGGVQ